MANAKPTSLASRVGARIRRITDGWENVITGLGTSRDKRTGAAVKAVSPTTDYAKLDDLFAGDDMAQKIAGRPPEDMVRKWITLAVELGEEGQTETEAETADDILQALDELDAKGNLKQALTWANVFGGGMVFVGVDDGAGSESKLEDPVELERVRAVTFLETFDRFDVQIHSEYDDAERDGMEKFGKPKTYQIINHSGVRGANLSSVIVHESRFLRFDGPVTSRRRRTKNDGWNDSIYTAVEEVLADFNLGWGSVAHLLQDFAAAVFKMKGLADAVAGEEGNLVLQRMTIMDQCRSTVRATPIDADDEEFTREPTPVSGLAELMDRFMLRLSAAAEMPVTILFGISPSGLNTTAEGDLAIWYDRIGSKQETDLRPPLMRLIELMLNASEGPTKGKVPEGWELSFNPLWELDEKERAEARKIQAETDAIYIDTNVIEPEEVADSRFAGESYSYETNLDKEARAAEADEPDAEPEPPVAPPVAPVAPVAPIAPVEPPPEPEV